MNKILLIVSLCLVSTTSFSQLIDKGRWIIALNANKQFGETYFQETTDGLNEKLAVLYMADLNMGLGISLLTDLTDHDKFEVGPVVRQYIDKYDIKPYVEIALGLTNRQKSSYSNIYIKPALGVSWWIINRIGLDVNVDYDVLEGRKSFDLNAGLCVKLG